MELIKNYSHVVLFFLLIYSLIGGSSELDISNHILSIESFVSDKNEYTFFPEIGGNLIISCENSNNSEQLSVWYKVSQMNK